jgi:hypothetical protein
MGRKGPAKAASMDPSQRSYTITRGEQGKRRLNLLAEIMRLTTLRLLAEAGLRRGSWVSRADRRMVSLLAWVAGCAWPGFASARR